MKKALITLLAGFSAAGAVNVYAADDAAQHLSWREMITRAPTPGEGCFKADYPSVRWERTECVEAPNIPYLPGAMTVGNGRDYAAETASVMSQTVGSFPTVKGVTSEKDGRTSNKYSIQLNSNFMKSSAACVGASCEAWEQFVYSSSEKSAFMQYWLINYGTSCPTGWNTYSGSCWKNSAATSVPKFAITDLSKMSMSGTATASLDTLVFTDGTSAYTTTGKGSVLYLYNGWTESEFNIIGDGGGSKATFNTGSTVTVKVAVDDGSTRAPTCLSNAGTTGETNNLTLGSCTTASGSSPYIQFTESN